MKTDTLKDFLGFDDETAKTLKIRLNDNHGDAIKWYLQDQDSIDNKAALWYSGKWWFDAGSVFISLLRIKDDDWLLTSVQRVIKRKPVAKDFVGIAYDSEPVAEYADLFKRLHVKFHRNCQSQVLYYKNIANDLKILRLDSEQYTGDDFKSCDEVSLSFQELSNIFKFNKVTWINGLSSSKAIYLITDKHTLKRYVGSAASDNEMLLSRWKNYATNGHGGNKFFKQIIDKHGFDYVKNNFEYTILEPHDYRADTNFLIERENFWKKVLHTSVDEGGMNYN